MPRNKGDSQRVTSGGTDKHRTYPRHPNTPLLDSLSSMELLKHVGQMRTSFRYPGILRRITAGP